MEEIEIRFPLIGTSNTDQTSGAQFQSAFICQSLVADLEVADQLLDLPEVLREVSLRRERLDVGGAGLVLRAPRLRRRPLVRGRDVARYPAKLNMTLLCTG